MKIVIAPDSFKGSLAARDAAEAMASGARKVFPDAEIVLLPVGDGGEGTVDALVAAVPGSRKIHCRVLGPMGLPVRAFYGLLGYEGNVAVVEMAAASGLVLVPPEDRDLREATTYGTGELIGYAAGEPGVEKLIVGLGGSATNDAGAGALQPLGICFFDRVGVELPAPIRARDLGRVVRAERTRTALGPDAVDVTIACDVTNVLTGPEGASYVFGPQKGATLQMARELDEALSAFAPVLDRIYLGGGGTPGPSIADRPGSGAAGGMAAGLMAFFPRAALRRGIDIVLDTVGFDQVIAGADLVLTGEGKLDRQTLSGKAVSGVVHRAHTAGVPVIAFAGDVEDEAVAALREHGLRDAVALLPLAQSPGDSIARAAELLTQVVEQTLRSPGE